MFRNKSDVDKRVSALLYNAKNEHERNLRCYNIALLYYKAHDFESAQRYATMYLSVRDDSAAAHKLLGQAFEKLGQKEKAIASYTKSLKLESDQSDLILKICELLCDKDVEFDPQMARYWSERASLMFPHSPPVFMLKEKLMMSDASLNSKDLEELLHAELRTKPADMNVRIQLLKLYADSGRVELAVNHAFEVEARQTFSNSLIWYQSVNNICKIYAKENIEKCNWEFYVQWISILDRMCSVYISEVSGNYDIFEISEAVHNLDQTIYKLNQCRKGPEILKEFLKYISAQLSFYMGTLLLIKAKKENFVWKETKKCVSPLLFVALIPPSSSDGPWTLSVKENFKKLIHFWVNHGHCRIVQAGYALLSLAKENHSEKMFLDKVNHFLSGDWRQYVFEKTFNDVDQVCGLTSHFMTSVEFSKVPLKMPSSNSLKSSTYVSSFENVYFGSLHHLVWLGLQQMKKLSITEVKLSSLRTTGFKSLQFTINSLSNVGVETINQLDIDTFLYASVFCAVSVIENQKTNGFIPEERLQVLPAVISPQLCSSEQSKWWLNVCSLVKGGLSSQLNSNENISDLRFNLQRGLEVIRGEGLSPLLMVAIARTFASRALNSEVIEEADGCQARSLHFWKLVHPILERFISNKSLITTTKINSLFDFPTELSVQDAKKLLDEAKFFIGCHFMNTNQYEKAIEEFKLLKSPQAIYNLAMVYQKWAEEQIDGLRGEEITSEIRCRHIVLASKAREYLLKVKSLIKNDLKHPLHSSVETKLLDVDDMLARIEPENERDANGTLDGSVSGGSVGTPAFADMFVSTSYRNRHHNTSTPLRVQEQKTSNFNMSELIDLLSVQHSTNQLKMQQVLEQIRLVVDKIDIVSSEQRNLIDGLGMRLNNFESEVRSNISEMRKDIKKTDICKMIEEDNYADEMLQYQNYSPYYPHTQRPVENSASALPYSHQYIAPRIDPIYQGNISFYNHGALPFSEGQQLPDFLRTIPPGNPKVAPPLSHLSQAVHLPFNSHINTSNINKTSVPANLVANTPVISTEPTPSTSVQTLSPPLNISITSLNSNMPHNFQIPLPPQPKLVINVDERIEKESPPPTFDPLPDYKPLVPLPKEIEVHTGEEDEEVLFEKKAKLFRFIHPEWKERGVGNLKILKHKVTGKFRILMRRDQIHKICANHFITEDMNLEPKVNADKAWVWVANDFADKEMKVEKFCAKFTSLEDSLEFKNVFDKAKMELSDQQRDQGASSDSKTDDVLLSNPCPNSSVKTNSPTVNIFKTSSPKLNTSPNVSTTSTTMFTPSNFVASSSNLNQPMSETNIGGFSFCLAKPKLKLIEEPKEAIVQTTKEINPFSNLTFGTSLPQNVNSFGSVLSGNTSFSFGSGKSKSVTSTELKKTFDDNKSTLSNKENESVFMAPNNTMKCKDDKKDSESKESSLSKNLKSTQNVPLSSIIKIIPGSWECKSCYVRNKSDISSCEACGDRKPVNSGDNKINEKSESNEGSVLCTNKTATIGSEKPSLASSLKRSPGSWECSACYVCNKSDSSSCIACGNKKPGTSVDIVDNKDTKSCDGSTIITDKPASVTAASIEKSSITSSSKPFLSDPRSSDNTVENSVKTSSVPGFVFGMPAQFNSDSPKFSFGSNSTFSSPSGFKFESSSKGTSESVTSHLFSEPSFSSIQSTEPQFTFGRLKFEFTMPEPKAINSSLNKSHDESHDSEPDEEEGDHLQFQPVIPLPDKITVVTGEENETVIYCQRAKLFRFDSSTKEWKERGVGDVKILQHKDTGKIRFLMRRDQVMKICLNHFITEEIIMRAKDEKTWLWYAVDYSERIQTKEQFAIRFKSPDIAKEFKDAFDGAQLKDSTSKTPFEGTLIKKHEGDSLKSSEVKESNVNSDSDLEITYEQKAPPELVEKALSLKLPPNYYCYLEKPPCSGCCGCETNYEDEVEEEKIEQSFSSGSNIDTKLPTEPHQIFSRESEERNQNVFGSALFSATGFSFSLAHQTAEPECRTNEDFRPGSYFFKDKCSFNIPASQNSIFGSTSTTQLPASTTETGKEEFSFGTKTAEIPSFESFTNRKTPIAGSFAGSTSTEQLPASTTEAGKEEFSFGTKTAEILTFESLTNRKTPIAGSFAGNQNFKWEGAGSQLFAKVGLKKSATVEDKEDKDNDVENEIDDGYDPHYDPVVPLPDKIELITGEEDEEIVFMERGQLYRYNSAGKEWKQRGVGDMKILKHKYKNVYRLVMRREQVHKLVCNHLIGADFELKTMSVKAFCWSALNYCPEKSDDIPVSENLSIRFKNEEQARQFKTSIENCVKSLKDVSCNAA